MEQRPIVKSSVAKQIAEQLRAAIMGGRLQVGDRLPTEDELATRYGVSRATVREALKRLAAQNLVRSRRGPAGGNFVNRPTHAELAESLSGAATLLVGLGSLDIGEIMQARRVLQGACLELAARQATEAQVRQVRQALERQGDPAISDQDFCAADVAFHRALVDATGNGMLRFVMYTVIEALVPITNMVVSYVRDREQIIALHRELLTGLQARDDKAMNGDLNRLLDYLTDRFAEAQVQRARP